MKKRLIIKLGSHVLTGGNSNISRDKIEDVAQQIISLKKEYDILLVSSGAIAAARHYLGHDIGDKGALLDKQALASIGQPILMKIYQEVFGDFNLGVAQCLFTYNDFERKKSVKNSLHLFKHLWQNNFIPIVNENDAIATDEIKFGDNDKLAALTAQLIDADLLILASDVDGLYTKDPKSSTDAELIEEINDLSSVRHFIEDSKSKLGSGGMTSKFQAAEVCHEAKIEMWIINGMKDRFAIRALEKNLPFSRFGFKK